MSELTPDVEAFLRREIQRQVKEQLNQSYGSFGSSSEKRYTPEEWDFQVAKANIFPGFGYELHGFVAITNDVYAIWRIKRDAAMKTHGYQPILKLPTQ